MYKRHYSFAACLTYLPSLLATYLLVSVPTYLPNRPGGASLATRRTQPSSLAVSRLTVYAVEDLDGGASLGFLGAWTDTRQTGIRTYSRSCYQKKWSRPLRFGNSTRKGAFAKAGPGRSWARGDASYIG